MTTRKAYAWTLQINAPEHYPDPIADQHDLDTPQDARQALTGRMLTELRQAWQEWQGQPTPDYAAAADRIEAWRNKPNPNPTGTIRAGLPDGRVLEGEIYAHTPGDHDYK